MEAGGQVRPVKHNDFAKLKAKSAKKDGSPSWEERWSQGIWLGIIEESGEIIIGTTEGVLKARSFRRMGSMGQWNFEEF